MDVFNVYLIMFSTYSNIHFFLIAYSQPRWQHDYEMATVHVSVHNADVGEDYCSSRVMTQWPTFTSRQISICVRRNFSCHIRSCTAYIIISYYLCTELSTDIFLLLYVEYIGGYLYGSLSENIVHHKQADHNLIVLKH